jgi:hypothetical protein
MYEIQAQHTPATRLLIAACEITDAFTVMGTTGIRADVVASALDALADLEGAFALLEAPEPEVVNMVVDLWIRVHRAAALTLRSRTVMS